MSNCTSHYRRVTEFMLRAKQECPMVPTIPSYKVRELRAKLILEEALETLSALGVVVRIHDGTNLVDIGNVAFEENVETVDLVKIADGCADLSVVNVGTLIACGIKDGELLEVVDQNNLDKFSPGHYIRDDGKLIKPPGHLPPDIDMVIRKQMPLNKIHFT